MCTISIILSPRNHKTYKQAMKSTSFQHNSMPTALKILAGRKYTCKFLPCLRRNSARKLHKHFMQTRSNQGKIRIFLCTAEKDFLVHWYKSRNFSPNLLSNILNLQKHRSSPVLQLKRRNVIYVFCVNSFGSRYTKKSEKSDFFVCHIFCITKMVPLTGLEPVRILLRGIFTLHYVTIAIQSSML